MRQSDTIRSLGSRAARWFAACVVAATCATALADDPLYQQEPFDQLTVKEAGERVVLKIEPLEIPGRLLPKNPLPNSKLQVRLFAAPEKLFEVEWKDIVEVKLFEQLVLAEAEHLTAQGEFGNAFDSYDFLIKNYPQLAGLDESIQRFLLTNAQASYRKGQAADAYARLLELHSKNPNYEGLQNALNRVGDDLIADWVKKQNFVAARGILDHLKKTYPGATLPAVARWEEQFNGQAGKLLAEAREHLAADRFGDARRACRHALDVWPDIPGGLELAAAINAKYPQVVVGTFAPSTDHLTGRLDDWASRRDCRLVNRDMMELEGITPSGGEYQFTLGSFDVDNTGRRISLRLRPDRKWSIGGGTIAAHDVARRVLELADPAKKNANLDWAELVESVSVPSLYEVEIRLRRPHLQPAAYLTAPLAPDGGTSGDLRRFGPYVIETTSPREARYLLSEREPPAAAQPKEIVSRTVRTADEATAALRSGEITAIDRVPPWAIPSLKQDAGVVVRRYAFPTVHVLIPNLRRAAPGNRTLRRAIVYGIHRESILKDELLEGQKIDGCQVVSGPFPARTSIDDPLGYASDDRIAPHDYDPRLSVALSALAMRELAAKDKAAASKTTAEKNEKEVEGPPPPVPPLVLAHPNDPISARACDAIRRHLERVGISVRLRPFEPSEAEQVAGECDFLYAALAVWEPVVDARRILGGEMTGGQVNAYLAQALNQLAEAADSTKVRQRLQEIHRLAHDDLTVIPLWQLVEHCAHQKSLRGVGERPVTLYQNVERWENQVGAPAKP